MQEITHIGLKNFSLPNNITPDKIALEFESLLFSYLKVFQGLKKLVPGEQNGFGDDILMPILEAQLSKTICEKADFGFKELLLSQLKAKELYESNR